MKTSFLFLPCLLLFVTLASADPSISHTAMFQPEKSDYVFYRGEISLPSDGFWDVSLATSVVDVVQFYLIPPENSAELQMGRRMLAVENDRQVRLGRNAVSPLYWPCRDYAKQHGNVGPSVISDLDAKKYPYVMNSIQRSPYETGVKGTNGPSVFLIPGVKFDSTPEREIPDSETKQVLAVELRPYVDDGKYWVVHTDGSCSRETIDAELVKKYGLTIRSVMTNTGSQSTNAQPRAWVYRIVVGRKQSATAPLPLVLRNSFSGTPLNVIWNLTGAETNATTVLADLKAARVQAWTPYALSSDSAVLNAWLKSTDGRVMPPRRNRGRATSLFGLFGGRAAVEETLQTQNLAATTNEGSDRTIPLETLKGVEVKSHPYEEMLKGEKGGELALANFAPPDRFFVYVARPESILPFLDSGAEFISLFGATLAGHDADYDLKAKYVGRLGLSPEWLKLFLKPEIVKEMAVLFPDLFFIDGTDVTVISRLTQPKLIQELLKQVGVADLRADNIVTRDLGENRIAFWAMRNDLLFVSTSRAELEAVLTLQKSAGRDSLGQTAEFRYMLTQLPERPVTRMYAYFSDPFIRRQVGPAVKISQWRRIAAQAKMEQIEGAALLSRLDGMATPDSIQMLVTNRYLPDAAGVGYEDYTIDTNLIVSSKMYGPLPGMNPLTAVPVDKVTPLEADAYKAYVDNYSRYWRQYFDPIAVRLDDAPGGSVEATTFILPLVDNTAYNSLREILLTREDGPNLKVPGLTPEPVLSLSLNLREESWHKIAEGLSEIFMRYGGVNPAVLDDLGPGLHLAIHDADPVIALGSGDLMGALNANLLGAGGHGGEMVFIPMALSVLTRPCSLIVETRNPERTRQYLKQTAGNPLHVPGPSFGGVTVDFSQLDGLDSWVCTLDIMGMVKLRYGLEVQGGYLVVRNIPWSNGDRVARVDTALLNGACLQAYPSACNLQLAGLFAADQDGEMASAMWSLGSLYPLVASGRASSETAAAECARLFGFKPLHPGDGKWVWDRYELTSSRYGTVFRRKQPPYVKDKNPVGLFKDIEHLCVAMQFEDSGLRTVVRWKAK